MTMVDGGTRVHSAISQPTSWHMVEDGFWVGNTDGMFLGTIERHDGDRFFARDATRAYVGEYSSLAAATAAVMERIG